MIDTGDVYLFIHTAYCLFVDNDAMNGRHLFISGEGEHSCKRDVSVYMYALFMMDTGYCCLMSMTIMIHVNGCHLPVYPRGGRGGGGVSTY